MLPDIWMGMKNNQKTLKTCPSCKEEKSIADFSADSNRKDYLAPYCKACSSKKAKKSKDLTVEERQKKKERRAALIDRNRDYIFGYLSTHPCVDCGEARIMALEFDHVRGIKRGNITTMMNSAWSLKNVQEEIEKCDVRCANCHRIKTMEQFGFARATYKPRPTKLAEPIKSERTKPDIVKRFWSKVEDRKNDQACWLWVAAVDKGNRGVFRLGTYLGTITAHKYVWEITYGVIPPKSIVYHTCDDLLCCNPNHLRLGTMKDCAMEREKRNKGNSKRGNTKLTKEQVVEIKKSKLKPSALAKKFGVAAATVRQILRGETWKHITVEGFGWKHLN